MMFFRSKAQQVPAMTLEGVLGPNSRLDEAGGLSVTTPEALCVAGDGQLLISSGKAVLALRAWGEEPALWKSFDHPVTALCGSPTGLVAVGLVDGTVSVFDQDAQPSSGWKGPFKLGTVTDCAFLSETELTLVASGYPPNENVLSVAPWESTPNGKVLAVSASGEVRTVISGLHCPMGVSCDAKGDILVAELERACIVDAAGRPRQSGYPAYLGRLRKTRSGYVMSCLARRDPLIEFLKSEHDFVAEMKANIPPQNWISPRVSPAFSHDFPIELGATRLFGDIKPWAPSFSYGLVIELDDNLMPVRSAHSRANGRRHAITDALSWNGDMIAISKASGEILNLGPEGAVS